MSQFSFVTPYLRRVRCGTNAGNRESVKRRSWKEGRSLIRNKKIVLVQRAKTNERRNKTHIASRFLTGGVQEHGGLTLCCIIFEKAFLDVTLEVLAVVVCHVATGVVSGRLHHGFSKQKEKVSPYTRCGGATSIVTRDICAGIYCERLVVQRTVECCDARLSLSVLIATRWGDNSPVHTHHDHHLYIIVFVSRGALLSDRLPE